MKAPRLTTLDQTHYQFPPASAALSNPPGLLAVGGDLSLPRMLAAYRQGIFPWFSQGDPILWWNPDPRAVLPVSEFHLSRSMQRFHRHSPFRATINQAFADVVKGCAEQRQEGTWITPQVARSWQQLHRAGYAHSLEIWQHSQLVGGIYGLALGRLFCGESMFSRRPNASKTALLLLCQHFAHYGGQLIDCQILNPHTASLGAREIPRADYLQQAAALQLQPCQSGCWESQTIF